MFQVEVFWFVTPCSVVVRYQRFVISTLKIEAGRALEALVSYHNTTRRYKREDDLEFRYRFKTYFIFIYTSVSATEVLVLTVYFRPINFLFPILCS